jgi:hypothetical protein
VKSPAAYYLLLLYITVVLKPLIPIATDWYQHAFNEIEHVAHVHEIYGSHHLQHEIADAGSGEDHHNNQPTLRSDDQVPFHLLVTGYDSKSLSTISGKNYTILYSLRLSSIAMGREGPPPRFT